MKTARFTDTSEEISGYAAFVFNIRSYLIHKYSVKEDYETRIKPIIDNVIATSPSVIYGDFLLKRNPKLTGEFLESYVEIQLELFPPVVSPL